MKKLIIHIGYMKTATTSLQLNIFTPLLKKGKIEYLNHTNNNDHNTHGIYSVNNIVSFILGDSMGGYWENEARELLKINNNITVLSNENISCFSEKYPTVSSLAGATNNAKNIYEIFTPYFDKIEIVVTVRAQEAMLVSFYTQVYLTLINFNPAYGDFGTWIEENFKQKKNKQGLFLDYHAMFTAYAKCFGKENIHVLVYEDLLNCKKSYYKKLSQILEIGVDEIQDLFEATVHNKTRKMRTGTMKTDEGDIHAALFSLAHKIFKKDSTSFAITKKIFKKIIPTKTLNYKIGNGALIRKLTDEERSFIKDLFDSSNEQLIMDAELDRQKMIRYGYINSTPYRITQQ